MIRIISLIALILLACSSLYSQHKIKGSGYVLTQQRETAYFNSISVSNRISVYIVQGNLQPITVEADNNLFPYIKTIVRNQTLKIYIPDTVDIVRFADMNVLISMPHISTLTARQSSYIDGTPQRWKADSIILQAGSESRIKLDAKVKNITITGRSSAIFELKGSTQTLDARLKTDARLIARDLASEKADLELATGAHAEVRVYKQIAYDLSGNAQLIIKGNPKVTKSEVNTGSKVSRNR